MNTDTAKGQMLRQQIRTWNVLEPHVLDALGSLSRADFVPAGYESVAYADAEIPLPHGRKMLQPKVEGRILQALELAPTDEVLEIGTGSGYLTACLARLAQSVVSVDRYEDLVGAAQARLEAAGIGNVTLLQMDPAVALPEGPFDAVVLTGSVRVIEQRLRELLRPGGRLFAVVGDEVPMEATLVRRSADGTWHDTGLFETSLAPLYGGVHESEFEF